MNTRGIRRAVQQVMGGTYLGRGSTYLGQGGTYLGWGVPTLAWMGYSPPGVNRLKTLPSPILRMRAVITATFDDAKLLIYVIRTKYNDPFGVCAVDFIF